MAIQRNQTLQASMIETKLTEVAVAVRDGLFRKDKYLPSWLFYNANGDKIFQEIMQMPEYYLTQCEYDILEGNKDHLCEQFSRRGAFQLVELGAGDGLKTLVLLKHFTRKEVPFSYHPIDISSNVLTELGKRIKRSVPSLQYQLHEGDYVSVLKQLPTVPGHHRVFLFLGSNIGNFEFNHAVTFLRVIAKEMLPGDLLLLGIDLKKDPELIRQAYDDAEGITRRFNLNLLLRLNDELGADFDLSGFEHAPAYDAVSGKATSHLRSLRDQHVYFEALQAGVDFHKDELLFTEVSLKYDQVMLNTLATGAGLKITHQYVDDRNYFCDVLLSK